MLRPHFRAPLRKGENRAFPPKPAGGSRTIGRRRWPGGEHTRLARGPVTSGGPRRRLGTAKRTRRVGRAGGALCLAPTTPRRHECGEAPFVRTSPPRLVRRESRVAGSFGRVACRRSGGGGIRHVEAMRGCGGREPNNEKEAAACWREETPSAAGWGEKARPSEALGRVLDILEEQRTRSRAAAIVTTKHNPTKPHGSSGPALGPPTPFLLTLLPVLQIPETIIATRNLTATAVITPNTSIVK